MLLSQRMIGLKLNFAVRAVVISVTFLVTFLVAWHLLNFLSAHVFLCNTSRKSCSSDKEFQVQDSWKLLWNLALICGFIIQHSLLPSKLISQYLSEIGLGDLGRAIYVLFTSVGLEVLLTFWKPTPICLWAFQPCSLPIWFLFSCAHAFTWLKVYGGSLMLDSTELLGISQAYYNFIRAEDPMSKKSSNFKKLLAHQRHPSFIGLLCLLWLVPTMTLDRLLLAIVLSLYSYLAWPVTAEDYNYHKQQLLLKHHEIAYFQKTHRM